MRRFSGRDRAIILAVQLEKAARCNTCGIGKHEEAGAFVAVSEFCPHCAAKDRARIAKQTEGESAGMSIQLVARATYDRLASFKGSRPVSAREKRRK